MYLIDWPVYGLAIWTPQTEVVRQNIYNLKCFKIGLDKEHKSDDTRIFYYTTGVLLEKLIQLKSLSHFTHIILDEVHERDKNMDFLFIILRKLLSTTRAKTKIILMSATIDAAKVN